jgi:hypothetical protein
VRYLVVALVLSRFVANVSLVEPEMPAPDERQAPERELDALLLADAKQHAGGSEGRF